jgi:hypothetical protein
MSAPTIPQSIKDRLSNGNLKKGGVAGAVIAAITGLGYAEIQRRENHSLMETNTALVQTITNQAENYRDQLVRVYTECHARQERP